MQSNKKIFFLFMFLLLDMISFRQCLAGGAEPDSARGKYSLVIYADAGVSYYSTKPGVPDHLQTTLYKIQPAGMLRLLWLPDHRLSIGAESGWITMYSYKLVNARLPGSLSTTAIPLMLEFSMPVTSNLRVFAGAGSYFETTNLDYAGKVSSHSVSLGWMAAGSYTFLSFEKLALGAEIKWLDAAEAQHAALCIQLQLQWKVITW